MFRPSRTLFRASRSLFCILQFAFIFEGCPVIRFHSILKQCPVFWFQAVFVDCPGFWFHLQVQPFLPSVFSCMLACAFSLSPSSSPRALSCRLRVPSFVLMSGSLSPCTRERSSGVGTVRPCCWHPALRCSTPPYCAPVSAMSTLKFPPRTSSVSWISSFLVRCAAALVPVRGVLIASRRLWRGWRVAVFSFLNLNITN